MSIAGRMFSMGAAKSDAERDRGLTTPEDIQRYDDISYGADPKYQMLDLYRPKAAAGKKLPVIMIFHGGGWVYGDKDVYQFYAMSLAQHGFAVVNFSYRLAPKHKFPASFEDANTVAHWVMDNREKYGLDTDRICGVGDSAGGMLLCCYSAITTNPEYEALFPFEVPEGFAFTKIALNCGVYYINLKNGSNPNDHQLISEDLLKEHGSDLEIKMINPIPFIREKFPAVFLMTAEGDRIVPHWQADRLETKLKEQGIPYVRHHYGETGHELGHVFHCNIRMPEARKCNDDETAFFLAES